MKKKDKNIKEIIKLIFGKSFFLFLISVICFFVSFYSFGKIEKENTITVTTTISNINSYRAGYGHGASWITLISSSNQTFYLRTDELDIGSSRTFANNLKEKTAGKLVTISVTNRQDLSPLSLIHFFDMERVVSIECDGETIISLDDYNSSNQGFLIGWVVLSALFFIAWLGYLLIKIFFLR